jgi:hypothetical protein
MSTQRHVLRRFEAARTPDFDEQFWPVVVALAVLAGLTAGTIVTILHGPWMWASLLALPLLVGLALLGLSYVEHRVVRRSIQFALLLSLAFHLLVVIVAFRTLIFSGRPPSEQTKFQPSPIPRLEISLSPREEFWNQVNEIETPRPEISNEHPPTGREQPKITRVESPETASDQSNASIERREDPADPTPRLGESLSTVSRRNAAANPTSRELSVAAAADANAASAESSEATPESTSLERRSEALEPEAVARRDNDPATAERALSRSPDRREEIRVESAAAAASSRRRLTELRPEPSTSPPQPTRTPTVAASDRATLDALAADAVAMRRTERALESHLSESEIEPRAAQRRPDRSPAIQSAAGSTSPTEPIRRPRESRQAAPNSVATEDQSHALRATPDRNQPTPQSTQVARQRTVDEVWESNAAAAPEVARTPTDQAARRLARSTPTEQRPSDLPTENAQPRLARDVAAAPTTTQPIESPAVADASARPDSAAMEAKPLSLDRSTSGTAGRGSSPNLSRAMDSAISPAQVASDSARRERATSNAAPATLSPSETGSFNRSQALLDSPRAALEPNAAEAERAAGNDPQPLSASSAAAITAASAENRDREFSADVGGAELDLGPTKIVSGAARRESAGGGQPELSPHTPSQALSGRRSGPSQATIAAASVSDSTAANLTEGSSQPTPSQAEPNAAAALPQRRGGDQASASGPARSLMAGDPSEFSAAANQSPLAASRRSERGEGAAADSSSESRTPGRRSTASPPTRDASVARNGESSRETVRAAAANADAEPSATGVAVARQESANPLDAAPGQSQAEDFAAGPNPHASNSTLQRNQSTNSSDGQTVATHSPQRSARRPQLQLESGADGSTSGHGQAIQNDNDGTELTARTVETHRARGAGDASIGPVAIKDKATAATAAPLVVGSQRNSPVQSDSPGQATQAARPTRRTARSPSDSSADGSATSARATAATGQGEAASDQVSTAKRDDQAAGQVAADWQEGIGGLDRQPAAELGIASRRAAADSEIVAVEPRNRFRRRDAGAQPKAASPTAAAAPFRGRGPSNLGKAGPQTEQAIEMGLAFLIRHQKDDGRWSLLGFDNKNPLQRFQLDSDAAATGLALLAFQGAGYTHREFKYAERLKRAVAWLLAHQAPDGNLYVESDKVSNDFCRLYSHGIVTLALAEAYGMTQDPELREPAQRAVDFIIETQDPKHGGWRYSPLAGRRNSDTSVTGWMVMALHSARLAGLTVDDKVWTGVNDWLDVAHPADDESQFMYSPYVADAPDSHIDMAHLRKPAACTTAIGLLMRMYTGWTQDDPRLAAGADQLLKQLPGDSNQQVRDTYYWYYASQVLRHVGGPRWDAWNSVLHPLLIRTQNPEGNLAGSWDPYDPVADRFGPYAGRLYVTALNLLSLEVDYRLLPLYQESISDGK